MKKLFFLLSLGSSITAVESMNSYPWNLHVRLDGPSVGPLKPAKPEAKEAPAIDFAEILKKRLALEEERRKNQEEQERIRKEKEEEEKRKIEEMKKNLDEALNKNKEITAKLDDVTKERDGVIKENTDLKNTLEEKIKEIQSKEKQSEEDKKEIAQLKKNVEELNAKIKTLEGENKDLKNKLKEATESNNNLVQQVSNLEKAKELNDSEKGKEIQRLNTQINQINEKNTKDQTLLNEQIKKLQEEVNLLKTELEKSQLKNTENEKKIENLTVKQQELEKAQEEQKRKEEEQKKKNWEMIQEKENKLKIITSRIKKEYEDYGVKHTENKNFTNIFHVHLEEKKIFYKDARIAETESSIKTPSLLEVEKNLKNSDISTQVSHLSDLDNAKEIILESRIAFGDMKEKELEKKNKDLTEQLTKATKELEDTKKALTTLADENNKTKDNLNKQLEELKNGGESAKTIAAEMEKLKNLLNEKDKKIKEQEELLQKLTEALKGAGVIDGGGKIDPTHIGEIQKKIQENKTELEKLKKAEEDQKKEIEKLKKENTELKTENEQLKLALKKANETAEQANTNLKAEQEKAKKLEREREEIQKALDDANNANKDVLEQMKKSGADKSKIEEKERSLAQEVARLNEALKAKKQEAETLKKENETKATTIKELENEIENLKKIGKEKEDKENELKKKLQGLGIDKPEDFLNEQSQFSSQIKKKEDLDKINKDAVELDKLKLTLKEKEKTIERLTNDVNSLTIENKTLKEQVVKLETALTAAKQTAEKANKELAQKKEAEKKLHNEIQAIKNQLDQDLVTLKKGTKEQNTEMEKLRNDLKIKTEEAARLQTENNQKDQKIQELNNQIETLNKELETYKKLFNDLTAKLKAAGAKEDDLKDPAAMQTWLKNNPTAIQNPDQIKKQADQLQAKEKELTQANQTISNLTKELQKANQNTKDLANTLKEQANKWKDEHNAALQQMEKDLQALKELPSDEKIKKQVKDLQDAIKTRETLINELPTQINAITTNTNTAVNIDNLKKALIDIHAAEKKFQEDYENLRKTRSQRIESNAAERLQKANDDYQAHNKKYKEDKNIFDKVNTKWQIKYKAHKHSQTNGKKVEETNKLFIAIQQDLTSRENDLKSINTQITGWKDLPKPAESVEQSIARIRSLEDKFRPGLKNAIDAMEAIFDSRIEKAAEQHPEVKTYAGWFDFLSWTVDLLEEKDKKLFYNDKFMPKKGAKANDITAFKRGNGALINAKNEQSLQDQSQLKLYIKPEKIKNFIDMVKLKKIAKIEDTEIFKFLEELAKKNVDFSVDKFRQIDPFSYTPADTNYQAYAKDAETAGFMDPKKYYDEKLRSDVGEGRYNLVVIAMAYALDKASALK